MADINITIDSELQPINVTIGEVFPEDVSPQTGGDMLKSIYDVDDDGIVDEVEKIDGGIWE